MRLAYDGLEKPQLSRPTIALVEVLKHTDPHSYWAQQGGINRGTMGPGPYLAYKVSSATRQNHTNSRPCPTPFCRPPPKASLLYARLRLHYYLEQAPSASCSPYCPPASLQHAARCLLLTKRTRCALRVQCCTAHLTCYSYRTLSTRHGCQTRCKTQQMCVVRHYRAKSDKPA